MRPEIRIIEEVFQHLSIHICRDRLSQEVENGGGNIGDGRARYPRPLPKRRGDRNKYALWLEAAPRCLGRSPS
jgi:hypothetical protein